jgi:hypothetical protein
LEPSPKTIDALMKINLPAGVDVEINLWFELGGARDENDYWKKSWNDPNL